MTWRALTNFNSKPRSSSTYHTGFQYDPVASITTSVTPSAANQSAIASKSAVNVENVRVCLSRPPPSAGVRTHAVTSALPTSTPAHRSTTMSITTPFTSLCTCVRSGGVNRSTTL